MIERVRLRRQSRSDRPRDAGNATAESVRREVETVAEKGGRANRHDNGYIISRDLSPGLVRIDRLRPLGRKTRKHPSYQIRKLTRSLREYGQIVPILVDTAGAVVSGSAVVQAAKKLGLTQIAAVTISDLTEAQLRSLRLALNRLSEDASWDPRELSLEFSDLVQLDSNLDLTISGFDMGEIDILFRGQIDEDDVDDADGLPPIDPSRPPISELGDLWYLGRHRLLCGDALDPSSFDRLMDREVAEMVFTDPPYNLEIEGNVSGLGGARHGEFAMASGEMSEAEFTDFLRKALLNSAAHSIDGAVHFICMDWRHLPELMAAGRDVYHRQLNLCIWAKTNAGMGSLYRSQHELIVVFKHGAKPHVNNVELGRHGRHRSNVWTYRGMNSFGAERDQFLAQHPTVKPLALVEDAILDCSNRGGIVLDAFVGSGTTLIAAERTGRYGFGLEIEPRYVDVALRRFRAFTGIEPLHVGTGLTLKGLEGAPPSGTGRKTARPNAKKVRRRPSKS